MKNEIKILIIKKYGEVPDCFWITFIISDSGSWKINYLLNFIAHQPDIYKLYL